MKIALIRGVVTIAELSNLDFQRLKNISGLRWNRTTRCMVGPVSLNLLDGLARYYKLPADMETKRQRLGKTRREIDAERLAEDPAPLLPYPVKANLYKHQIRGANMALRAFGALDAKTPGGGFGELFEMGCGKTLTTIAVAGALYNLGKIDRVLVVAPTSVCSVWPHDLNQFAAFPWEARVSPHSEKHGPHGPGCRGRDQSKPPPQRGQVHQGLDKDLAPGCRRLRPDVQRPDAEPPRQLPGGEPRMTILEQVDAYRGLLDQKERLADATKENNKALEEARNALAQAMIDEETPQIKRFGYSYSVALKTKYSKRSGADQLLMDTLRDFGLGDLIKETVNAQSLQGAMSNLAAENDDQLPDEFQDCVNTYEFYDVTRRKAAK